MTRLNYDIDNFSGKYHRGVRYALLVDGSVVKTDLSDSDADYFAEMYLKNGYEEIEIIEL